MENILQYYGTSGKHLLDLVLSSLEVDWSSLFCDDRVITIKNINIGAERMIVDMRNYVWKITTVSRVYNDIRFKLEELPTSNINMSGVLPHIARIYLNEEEKQEALLQFNFPATSEVSEILPKKQVECKVKYGFEDVD